MKATRRSLPWWETLEFLAPQARLDFGRLIAGLRRGVSLASAAGTSEEPAGWSGLTRRGPWHRLLPSELGVLEASPEEFARRADVGELGFWELATEGEKSRSSVWIWLDVGPDQLGACRVVQMAILLWMQQVCLGSGGEIYWGTIQEPDKGYERVGAEALKRYLASRSVDPPRQAYEKFPGLEVWCVGSPAWVEGLPRHFRRVALSQIEEGKVEVREGHHRFSLRLPSARRALALLRDPSSWGLEQPTASSAAAQGRLVFSDNGRKLLFVAEDKISVMAIPTSSKDTLGRIRSYPLLHHAPVVAVSMERKAIHVVQAVDDRWLCYRLNPPSAQERFLVDVEAPIRAGRELGTCWSWLPGVWRVWVDERLYLFQEGKLLDTAETLGGVKLGLRSAVVTQQAITDAYGELLRLPPSPLPDRVCFVPRYPLADSGIAIMACQMVDGTWKVGGAMGWGDDLGVKGEVLDLVALGPFGTGRDLALLVQREGRWSYHGIGWQDGQSWHEPAEIPTGTRDVITHPNGLIAYRTEEGRVSVYSSVERQTRWTEAP